MPRNLQKGLALRRLFLGALVCLATAGTARAQTNEYAYLFVKADSRGGGTESYFFGVKQPLSKSEQSRIEASIGTVLEGPEIDRDDGDNDHHDDATKTAVQSPQLIYEYVAARNVPLTRDGLAFSGTVPVAPLLAALQLSGIQELNVTITHPRKIDPATAAISTQSGPEPARNLKVEDYKFRVNQPYAADVRVLYGDPGPPPGWRLALLTLLAGIPILIVFVMRSSVLKRPNLDPRNISLIHTRFVSLVTTGLVAYWWSALSLLDIGDVLFYKLAFKPVALRVFADAVLGVGAPALIFVCCEILWAAVRARAVIRAQRPGDPSRSPVLLFARGFLPIHFGLGFYFYFFHGEMFAGGVCILASLGIAALSRKFGSKPGELSLYTLLAPDLRNRIFELASRAGVKLREVFVLPESGNNVINAFATANRCIWMSESLLRKLNRREVDAIVAHELGHLKRSHPIIRSLGLSGPLLLGTIIELFFSNIQDAPWHASVTFPLCLVLGLTLFFLLARKFEYSADGFASALIADPEAMITGLARVTAETTLPLNWSKWEEKFLTHPSTSRRAKRIARKNGLSETRLNELLQPSSPAVDSYSLAAGPSGASNSSEASPSGIETRKSRRRVKTRYSAIPVYVVFIVIFLGFNGFFLLGTSSENQSVLFTYPDGIFYFCGLVTAAIALAVWRARSLKKKLAMGGIADWSFKPEFSGVATRFDSDVFNTLTAELESIGFTIEGDFAGDRPATALRCFHRLLIHRSESCYATLTQVATETLAVTPVTCSITTVMRDGGLQYTTNAEPNASLYACRLPTDSPAYRIGSTPADLFKLHLERTRQLAAEEGLEALRPPDRTTYLNTYQDYLARKVHRMRKRPSILFLIEVDLFNRNPKSEWGRRRGNTTHPGPPQPEIAT